MILSFPIDAWLLLIVAVGLGLGLEAAFYLRHRRRGPAGGEPRGGGDLRSGENVR